MKFTLATLALAGLAAAVPQASSATEAPAGATGLSAPGSTPQGCDASYPGNFEITIVKPSGIQNKKRQANGSCGQTGILTLNLKNGVLQDSDGRTGYIVQSNKQFQFDKPVQSGAQYTQGFSVCKNGSIALGGTTTFQQCQSGGFYNLYFGDVTAQQCSPVNIDVIPCDGQSSSAAASSPAPATNAPASGAAPATTKISAAAVSAATDGQPQGTAKATMAPVSVFSDGQPQATQPATSVKPVPVSQFTDGQPQATANATIKAAPAATIVPAGAANIAVNGGLFAGVLAVAAAML